MRLADITLNFSRRKALYLCVLLIPPILWVDTGLAADRTLRCHGRLVSIGDTSSEVLTVCGEPDVTRHWEEGDGNYISRIYDYENDRYQAPELIKGPIRVERWTYNFGANRFIRYLRFENGKLVKIETGEKGSD